MISSKRSKCVILALMHTIIKTISSLLSRLTIEALQIADHVVSADRRTSLLFDKDAYSVTVSSLPAAAMLWLGFRGARAKLNNA